MSQELLPPSYVAEPEVISPAGTGSSAPKKRNLINRIITSAEVVLTSVEATAGDLISSGTTAAANAAQYVFPPPPPSYFKAILTWHSHKYGADAGHATALLGGSVRNVAVMYVDVRGVGRKAIVKRTAKGVWKARMRNGEEVQLQGEGERVDGMVVEAGEIEKTKDGETVIGMPQIGGKLEEGGNAGVKGYEVANEKTGLPA